MITDFFHYSSSSPLFPVLEQFQQVSLFNFHTHIQNKFFSSYPSVPKNLSRNGDSLSPPGGKMCCSVQKIQLMRQVKISKTQQSSFICHRTENWLHMPPLVQRNTILQAREAHSVLFLILFEDLHLLFNLKLSIKYHKNVFFLLHSTFFFAWMIVEV
jgi:hypothetical protein